jgi:uncharacterized membrane protein
MKTVAIFIVSIWVFYTVLMLILQAIGTIALGLVVVKYIKYNYEDKPINIINKETLVQDEPLVVIKGV